MRRSPIVLVFLLASLNSFAQTSLAEKPDTADVNVNEHTVASSILLKEPIPPLNILDMPAAFSYDELGIFCKFEYQLAKKVPLKIRLGEVKYTEALEGK